MIGIVVVSHSRPLAAAAVALATEMAPVPPPIAVAAGVDETSFGTDAVAISEAITEVFSDEGVLVLLDLGSAILSAEMALDFLDPEVVEHVRLSPAPLVEGLVAAVVTAASGAGLDEVAAEAAGATAAKQDHLGESAGVDASGATGLHDSASTGSESGPEASAEWTIRNPHGLHARPAAAVVAALRGVEATVTVRNATTGTGPANAASLSKLATLGLRQGHVMAATAVGPQADQALQALSELADADFGESVPGSGTAAPDPAPTSPAQAVGPQASQIQNATVSSPTSNPTSLASGTQVVVGPALRHRLEVDLSTYRAEADEWAQLRAALTVVHHRLGGSDDEILRMQAVLLDDPELVEKLRSGVQGGGSAPEVVQQVFSAAASDFEALEDSYQAERAQDLRSLRRLVLAELVGLPAQTQADHAHVLVVDELDAATAAGLDPERCLAVVTVTGGATGHGVIIATGRGIPVLTGRAEAGQVIEGTTLAVDPVAGDLWIDPDQTTLTDIESRRAERDRSNAEALALAHEPATTPDGRQIRVEANIGSIEDAHRAAAAGAEGSGLVRTELLFGDWPLAPTAEEQAEVLITIGQALAPHPITVRTWDVGGDKPLPYLPQEQEANPFLGERGLRTMRRVPEFFEEQLRGIALAATQVPVRVMFPMVTEPDEMAWARGVALRVIEQVGVEPFPIGMMVEVPSAALRAAEFAGLTDFLSIGTNDLTQYTTATDRSNARVAHLAQSDSPAVLELIRLTCQRLPWLPVAVCGDLASQPALTATMIELGITELSCRPALVAQIKQSVRAG